MSFRISNFRAIDLKVVELCAVGEYVFSSILVWFGWSLCGEIGYIASFPVTPIKKRVIPKVFTLMLSNNYSVKPRSM